MIVTSYRIDKPAPSTQLFTPSINAEGLSIHSFLVMADQAIDVVVQESIDGESYSDLQGYSIDNANFTPNVFNSIAFSKPSKLLRLKITTLSTTPSFIFIVYEGL